MSTQNPPSPADAHRRAVEAVQTMFRLCPLEATAWLRARTRPGAESPRVVEASLIEQPPRRPPCASPPPTLASFDLDEARRHALARGGCEVELLARVRHGARARTAPLLLGVALPEPGDDGAETPWRMLGGTTWRIQAWRLLVEAGDPELARRGPVLDCASLYLWPSTGLRDPQENCSVTRAAPPRGAPGDPARDAELAQERALNRERQALHAALDRDRREAAARRLALTGDAGITDAELAALVPAVDVERDRISLALTYPLVRLWEIPLDALIEELPPACLGLAMFGHRPAGAAPLDVLRRCAWALRRATRDAKAERVSRAIEALAALARTHLDAEAVERVLTAMRLR